VIRGSRQRSDGLRVLGLCRRTSRLLQDLSLRLPHNVQIVLAILNTTGQLSLLFDVPGGADDLLL
jgi:hypothetical protein